MGKEKEKDKDKKDKDKDKEKKDKDKKDKDKKDKDKDKEKKDKDKKDKDKDKEKKDKDKKEKDKSDKDQEWKLSISKTLDNYTHAYEKITNKFRDIDNYILRDADSIDDFIDKVKKTIEDLPESSQAVFHNFVSSLE
ncbi:hypothetical protein LCGC14_0660550 [marine sediment metagenome]|uniref:Uncharacterized protein n=1 Tax=marine sediment metagenome TaxID=412755 RepID=A0A0F9TF31_9ZZZZ